jgi:hypothetical protein
MVGLKDRGWVLVHFRPLAPPDTGGKLVRMLGTAEHSGGEAGK